MVKVYRTSLGDKTFYKSQELLAQFCKNLPQGRTGICSTLHGQAQKELLTIAVISAPDLWFSAAMITEARKNDKVQADIQIRSCG